MEEPLRTEVRNAFAGSLQTLWRVSIGLSGLGLLVSLGMKGLPLHTAVDGNWGLKEGDGAGVGSVEALRVNDVAMKNLGSSVGEVVDK